MVPAFIPPSLIKLANLSKSILRLPMLKPSPNLSPILDPISPNTALRPPAPVSAPFLILFQRPSVPPNNSEPFSRILPKISVFLTSSSAFLADSAVLSMDSFIASKSSLTASADSLDASPIPVIASLTLSKLSL